MLITSNDERVAGGILKDPTWLLRTIPCSINIDEFWAHTVKNTMPVAQIGNILINILSSSICVTVQSLQGL
jgi:hypothetical protein